MTADPIWTAIPEHELVPYQALSRLPVRSLLVLAPHPDAVSYTHLTLPTSDLV